MRCKRIVASTILSLVLSFSWLFSNAIVLAEDPDNSNLIPASQGFNTTFNKLTLVKEVVGTDPVGPPYTVKVTGISGDTNYSIPVGTTTISGLAAGDYSIQEPDTHGASVSIEPANFTIAPGATSVWASFNNSGKAMTGTVTWELYYAAAGSPMTGSKITSGVFGPVAEGDSGIIEYTLTGGDAPGSYMFHVYQRPGNSILDLWSGPIDVSATVPANPVVTVTNTFASQAPGTLKVVKTLAGTASAPPASGFKVVLTPSGGGSAVETDIDANVEKNVSLNPGDYTLAETNSNGADVVEYSTDNAAWNTTSGTISIAPGSTTTIYIRNTFNAKINPPDTPTNTGNLKVIKILAGTSTTPPKTGFNITLTGSLGGPPVDRSIVSGVNLIKGLHPDDYALLETNSNGAEKVEYSFDNINWGSASGSVPIAPESTTIVYIRNTFNAIITDNSGGPVTIIYEEITVPDPIPVFVPQKEVIVVKPPVDAPKEEVMIPDSVPELPYTGAASMDLTGLGLLLTAGGMVLRRVRP